MNAEDQTTTDKIERVRELPQERFNGRKVHSTFLHLVGLVLKLISLYRMATAKSKDTVSNPHFYPDTAFEEEFITQILPLGGRNMNKNGGRWTERTFVYGDNTEGRIRLTSGDETITRIFGAVTQCLVRPLTLFKGLLASKTTPWCSYGFRIYRRASVSGGGSRSSISECSQSQMVPMAGFLFHDRP